MGAKGTAVAGLRKPSLYLSTDVEAQPSACLAAKFNTTYLSHSFRSTFVPGLVIPERSYTHACEIANRNYDTVAPTTSIWECCFVHRQMTRPGVCLAGLLRSSQQVAWYECGPSPNPGRWLFWQCCRLQTACLSTRTNGNEGGKIAVFQNKTAKDKG